MKRLSKRDYFALIILFLLITAFLYDLFYPSLKVFITPEMGVSDIWQYNFPVKNFLRESLLSHQLPIWNKNMGSGFPVLAEAQVGAFYLPNLILFSLFGSFVAFNLSYVLTYSISGISMYFLARLLKRSRVSSLLASITFMFGGFFITHIYHINMIQSAAFLPLIFLLSYLIINRVFKQYAFLFVGLTAFVIAQQIFAGFPQMVFLTLFTISSYILFQTVIFWYQKKGLKIIKPALLLIIAVILGFLLASIQLFPTFEMTHLSQRSVGLNPREVLSYSFKPSLFKTFIDPFAFGSPKDGSYPNYTEFGGAIFWENTGYIGIIPLLLGLAAFLLIRKNKDVLFLVLLLIASALLMLGKYSPLYILLLFPPVNFFRIHSRFILIVIFSLSLLSAFSLDGIILYLKKIIINKGIQSIVVLLFGFLVIGLTVFDLYKTWYHYQLKIGVEKLSSPDTVQFLDSIDHGRVITLNRPDLFARYFNKYGWTKPNDYIKGRNALLANSNLTYNIPEQNAYAALYTKRWQFLNSLIQSGFEGNPAVLISSPSARLLSANNVTHLITTPFFHDDSFEEVYRTPFKVFDFDYLAIFENKNALGRAYFTTDYTVAKTITEAVEQLTADTFIPGKTVVLEKEINLDLEPGGEEVNIEIVKDDHLEFTVKVNTAYKGILVLSDSYYPGWKVYIDGKEHQLLPANINNRAVLIDKGNHIVKFTYDSKVIKIGAVLSMIALLIIVILIVYPLRSSFLQKDVSKTRFFGNRKNTPGKSRRAVHKPQ